MSKFKNKRLAIFLIFVFVVAVCLIRLNGGQKALTQNNPELETQTKNCYAVEEKIVRGESLSPLVNSGDTVKILSGYYDCHEVLREDIVAYDYKGNDVPIIKIVKGLPGDEFGLMKRGSGWNILINGQPLKNSEGKEYSIGQSGYNMISLYIGSYKGVIPKKAYLILGNITAGTTDSTAFGLVGLADILGKVEPVKIIRK
jgi:signal peptidase I